MPATRIMVIRHAERPDDYNGKHYAGIDLFGVNAGQHGRKHLAVLGWQRAGALVTLFAPPWGPKKPLLATPDFLFASNPSGDVKTDDAAGEAAPSQRPYETLLPLARALRIETETKYRKAEYAEMVAAALACDGVVLIAWQHETIPLLSRKRGGTERGICGELLLQTKTPIDRFQIPSKWPKGREGARYDLIWIFNRPAGKGPIRSFTLFPQRLMSGDDLHA